MQQCRYFTLATARGVGEGVGGSGGILFKVFDTYVYKKSVIYMALCPLTYIGFT